MDHLHSIEDVAEAFGLSAATVRDLCRRHDWPHVKLGRAIRFTDAQVAEIVELHSHKMSPEAKLMARTGLTRRSAQRLVRNQRPRRRVQ